MVTSTGIITVDAMFEEEEEERSKSGHDVANNDKRDVSQAVSLFQVRGLEPGAAL